LQSERKQAEQLCLGTARGERNADAACRLDDAAGDLQEMQADGRELGVPLIAILWNIAPSSGVGNKITILKYTQSNRRVLSE
jgi:hypothetical protein